MVDLNEHVYVVGAGIIGVSCALELRKVGYRVTILSRDQPGQECSFGAAGNYGGNVHFAIPKIAYKVPKMYFDKKHPFSFHFRDVVGLWRWFGGYSKASEPLNAERIAQTFKFLGSDVYETYRTWLREVGKEDLISKRGRLFVWTTEAGYEADRYGIDFRRRQDIQLDILSSGQVRELEPTVPDSIFKGAYAPESGHLLDPVGVVEALLEDFLKRGGNIQYDNVKNITEDEHGVFVTTSTDRFRADQLVLAMGLDTLPFALSLGVKVPLVAERGYHVMFDSGDQTPKIPVMWEERKVLFTGMNLGLRVAGIAEFLTQKRAMNPKFSNRLESTTQEFFPQYRDKKARSDWAGYRPVTPDYLPVIGRAAEKSRVIHAYGHGHSGYWFAPKTAQLVRELATRTTVSQQALASMSPLRF